MRAIRPTKTGGPEQLVLEDLATPAPGATEVLVRVEAAGVNYVDVYHLSGLYPLPLPLPIGLEGAGTVEQLGAQVRDLRVGERVAWASVPGSYSSHVVAPADKLVPVPEGLASDVAAALLLQGMTAHCLTQTVFALRPEHVALVHAAAGGVGLLLVQMARRAGARVIGTVSTEAKAALAKEAGADHVINYQTTDFATEVKRLTRGRGVDVAYDSVGRETFDDSLACLAQRGFLVLYGQSSGVVPPVDPARLGQGSYFLTRPSIFHYTATRSELVARARHLFELVVSGNLRVRIDRTFPLAQAAEAHRALTSRATTGKVLLIP
ncbi:MAG: quinone oxidoreductase [Deltaproteobacteria bacterium]|nr:quinone oxidoreductase [Deltaproteobacteria bacterium]